MTLQNKKRYERYIIGLPILFIIVTSLVIGGFNIYNINKHHDNEIIEIRNNLIKEQKNLLKNNVDMINTRIEVMNENMYNKIEFIVKDKIDSAYKIISSLYLKYKDTKSEKEIKEMIKITLSSITWRDGENYFWVIDHKGFAQVLPEQHKQWLGKNLLNIKDNNGNYTIQNEIDIVKTKKSGYLHNTFKRYKNNTKQYQQISYVKDLGFYDWYIGTAEFIDVNKEEEKKNLVHHINNVKFNGDNYIFVFDILNINGGDKFAKMIVNKNRPDLIGKYLSDSYKDSHGKQFRKEFLEKIRKQGYAWVEYHYKKLDGRSGKKLSYFYYNKTFNWVIANGFYYDNIDKIVNDRITMKYREIRNEVIFTVVITFILAFTLSIFSIFVSKNIKSLMDKYDNKLKKLNKDLAKMVENEIAKNQKKDLMIFKQSKSALMGEMIGNIAHQWRQPLNSIGATMMKLEIINELEFDNNEKFTKIVEDTNNSLEYMSNTIDDFRNFFISGQKAEEFYAFEVINNALSIIKIQFDRLSVVVTVTDNEDKTKIIGYKNELVQVVLNILNNSKDAIVSKQKNNKNYEPKIDIIINDRQYDTTISIIDNAGGISEDIIEKIFEPYFTTKFKSKGTGIGLYMSKMIVEKDMNGSLIAENTIDGVCFSIVLAGGGRSNNIV